MKRKKESKITDANPYFRLFPSFELRRFYRFSLIPIIPSSGRYLLKLIGEGKSDAEIARELGIALRTAETRVGYLYDKLKLSTREELVEYAKEQGLVVLPNKEK